MDNLTIFAYLATFEHVPLPYLVPIHSTVWPINWERQWGYLRMKSLRMLNSLWQKVSQANWNGIQFNVNKQW